MRKQLIKVYYLNTENSGKVYFYVYCKTEELDKIKNIIIAFKNSNPYHVHDYNFIEELKRKGYKVEEVSVQLEVY